MASNKTKKSRKANSEPKTLKGRKKGKKSNKISVSSSSGSLNMKYDQIDVTKLEQVSKLVEHIKNNVVTLVLIYADWCGHCGVFKNGIWKKLAGLKNRKMAMALINESVLKDTPFSDLKIDGYPTTTLIGKDMKPVTIKNENGEDSNALPNHRDEEQMSGMVTADPSEIVKQHSFSTSPSPVSKGSEKDVSASPTPEAEKARSYSAETTENSNIEESAIVPNPPNTDEDILSSSVNDGTINDLRQKEDTRNESNPFVSSSTVGGGGKTRRSPRGKGTLKKMRGRGKK